MFSFLVLRGLHPLTNHVRGWAIFREITDLPTPDPVQGVKDKQNNHQETQNITEHVESAELPGVLKRTSRGR